MNDRRERERESKMNEKKNPRHVLLHSCRQAGNRPCADPRKGKTAEHELEFASFANLFFWYRVSPKTRLEMVR